MKYVGKVKLDSLHRFSIPAELRKTWKIFESDEIEMYMYGNSLVLQKVDKNSQLGYRRRIDPVGRITVPMEFMRYIDPKNMNLFVSGKKLFICEDEYFIYATLAPMLQAAVEKKILTYSEQQALYSLMNRMREDEIVRMV